MPAEIILPQLGMMQTDALLVEWLRNEGTQVAAGEPVAVIQTDKADVEVEAPADGQLAAFALEPGQSAAVGTVIAYVLAPGESAPAARSHTPVADATSEAGVRQSLRREHAPPSEFKASPGARQLARRLEVDLAAVVPTGPGGRITEEDLRGASRTTMSQEQTLSRVRQITADRMARSFQTAPHLYLEAATDATAILARAREGITVTDLILHATARALRAHPALNATFHDGKLLASERVALGLAVDTPDGLYVPVLIDVDKLDLHELSAKRSAVVERARTGALAAEDVGEATFTITNLGVFGIEAAWPILNPPGVAILAVGRAKRVAVVVDDEVAVRAQMRLILTADHRALDGAQAAHFLQTLTAELEREDAAA
jgi:pyruvate dehydrogenase E2 component (dihydrolipoamide acetyltransferase)